MEEQTLEELLVALSLLPAMIMMLQLMNMVKDLSPYLHTEEFHSINCLDMIR